jgi:lysophospholipase L1-like esterase
MTGGRAPDRRPHRLLPRSRLLLSAGLALSTVAAVAALSGVVIGAASAGADPPTTYYLAIGGSESVGVQPTPADPKGEPTDQGYADDLVTAGRGRWPGLQLVHVGCPGETTVDMVDGSDRCHYPEGSQLGAAVGFLRAHAPATVLATVDLGFNDVRPCLAHQAIDEGCVTAALARIDQTLPGILSQLKAAGGASLYLVGFEHYDPYLGDYLDGTVGRAFAMASVTVIDQLNSTLDGIYADAGVPVADQPRVFDTDDQRPTALAGYGTVPADVAQVCTLTWMCAPAPYAHNVHPNAGGYRVIADAAAAALGIGTDPNATPGAS